MKSVRVTVPASTSNLGSGFDALGLAVNLRNEIIIQATGAFRTRGETVVCVTVEGFGMDVLTQTSRNLVAVAALKLLARARKAPERLCINQLNRIPLGSGLGSSGAATVGGLVAANEIAGRPFKQHEILSMAVEMEGHPDNVAPALYGGFTICAMENASTLHVLRPRVRNDLHCIFCVPNMTLATSRARKALPSEYSRADVVFALSRAAMITALLQGGAKDLFRVATQDRLHQPYRRKLLPGMAEAIEAAEQAGAIGACLSGAGPTVLAFVDRSGSTEKIGRAMVKAYAALHIGAEILPLAISPEGVRIGKP